MSIEILSSLATQPPFGTFDPKPFRCPVETCKRDFTSKRNLVDHLRGHHQGSKPHTCNFPGCGKSFLRPAHLLIHNRIHTGEKPFVCDFVGCGKRWNQKSALKQHMRSHTGEKPFACPFDGCTKIFSTSSSCKRHFLTHQKPEIVLQPKHEQILLVNSDSISPKKRKQIYDYCFDHEEPHQPLKKLHSLLDSKVICPWIFTPKDFEFSGDSFRDLRMNLKMTLNFILN